MVEGWDDFFREVKKEAVDITLDNFLQKHFANARYEEFRKEVRQYAMGFDVADPTDVSALSLYKEWSQEETNYRIKSGYGSLVNFLEKECRKSNCEIVLGEMVKRVDSQANNITVTTDNAKTYTADKILITAPVNIISEIEFSDSIEECINASKQIGFGSVIKIIIEFNTPLWAPGTRICFQRGTCTYLVDAIPFNR